ncbi:MULTISPECIES: hypothetical protein [Bacillus]|nr:MULTISPECIES: hypothetical protein [Bacillus]
MKKYIDLNGLSIIDIYNFIDLKNIKRKEPLSQLKGCDFLGI